MLHLYQFFSLLVMTLLANIATATIANFDVQSGTLTLPEVKIIPNQGTFEVTMQQVKPDEYTFELTHYQLTRAHSYYSPSVYNSIENSLYIPLVSVLDDTYEVSLRLQQSLNSNIPHYRLVAAKHVAKQVMPIIETPPVPVAGDAADDPAIWLHPTNLTQSVIIGTQKQGAVVVYDLTGKEIQYLADGNMNNVDLRYNFKLNNQLVTIVAASNRSNNSIALYRMNPETRHLENIAARIITTIGLSEVYGLCLYYSMKSGNYYVFVNDKNGLVQQWQLFDNGQAQVDARLVRSFSVGSRTEGCVADDINGTFYISEELVGVWKYNAEPDGDNTQHTLVDSTTGGHLTAEVEGLTIYYVDETKGYLIVSNQGNHTFSVYNRDGNNDYLGTFQVMTNQELNIDGVFDTDGIDVTNVPLNDQLPHGIFVVQDGINFSDNVLSEENQNFKFVSWDDIAKALGLEVETHYDQRNIMLH